jgi:PAS domain S-box-containing protein/diguanylate cyclase (GGDEF)-like protein
VRPLGEPRPGPLFLLPDAAIEIDSRGAIVDANAQARELFGTADLAGRALETWLPAAELIAGAAPHAHGRVEGRRANGVPVLVDTSVARLATGALLVLREVNHDALADEAERHFDVIFDTAPIGKALINCDGEYVRVNPALCTLLGRAEEDLLGRRDQEFTHPDDRQADVDVAWEILSGAYDTHQCEKRFVRPDGSIVWVLANLTFVRDERGQALSWFGQFQDITARRAAEDALRESEERHRLVVRNLPGAGVVLYDLDLRCVLIEGRHMQDIGVSQAGMVGRPLREIVLPALADVLEPAVHRALAGESVHFEASSALSGRVLSVDVVPHRDAAGAIVGALVRLIDVTERHEAEERFRMAFEHAPIGIALVSPEGGWLRVNGRLCAMLGYTEDELAPRTFQELTHPDDLDADLEYVRAMLAGEIQTYEMEKRYVRRDGRVTWMALSVSLVRDPDGRPLYFISQLQDIDERKRAQGELAHLAHNDALTGIPNRRAWDAELERAIERAGQSSRPLAVALLDLNEFKQVNDNHGHHEGDRALVASVRAWQAELRAGDVLARIGGDEFALLLLDCPPEHLATVAGRLKASVPHTAGCGVGIATLRAGDDAPGLMRRADDALYADKAARRAQTVSVITPRPAAGPARQL